MLSHRFEVTDFTIKMRNVSGAGDPGTFGCPGIAEYRDIIIPSLGAQQSAPLTFESVKRHLNQRGVNINNYREVAAYFDLK